MHVHIPAGIYALSKHIYMYMQSTYSEASGLAIETDHTYILANTHHIRVAYPQVITFSAASVLAFAVSTVKFSFKKLNCALSCCDVFSLCSWLKSCVCM
jgi:hypothetical protein